MTKEKINKKTQGMKFGFKKDPGFWNTKRMTDELNYVIQPEKVSVAKEFKMDLENFDYVELKSELLPKFHDDVDMSVSGKTPYSTVVDAIKIGDIIMHNVNDDAMDGKAAPFQRNLDRNRVELINNSICGEDDEPTINYIPMQFIINVVSDELLYVNEHNDLFLKVPKSQVAIEKYAKYIHVYDCQHRGAAVSHEMSNISEFIKEWPSSALIYNQATTEEMIAKFYEKNCKGKNISAELGYVSRRNVTDREVATDVVDKKFVGDIMPLSGSEAKFYDVIMMLNRNKFRNADGIDEFSPLHNKLKIGFTENGVSDGHISIKTLVTSVVMHGQEVKDKNLLTSLRKYGFVSDEEMAKALNMYLRAFQVESCNLKSVDVGNPFSNNSSKAAPNPCKMGATRAVLAINMAEVCLDILHEKKMEWTMDNVRGLIHILFNDIIFTTFDDSKFFSNCGKSNIREMKEYLAEEMRSTCKHMRRKTISTRCFQ